ncbi:hypothetical protein ACQP2X_30470 [Actinoplanes sp. CA-131856]
MSRNDDEPKVTVEFFDPESTEVVELDEVTAIYGSLGTRPASFTWNDCGDEVLTVSVGEDHSTVTLLRDRSFYDLVHAEVEGEETIEMDGDVVAWPKALILPREKGLELLTQMPRVDEVFDRYEWRIQD